MSRLKCLLHTKVALGIVLGGFLLVNLGTLAPKAFGFGNVIINPGHLFQDGDGTYYCVCNWTPQNCGFCN